MIVRKNNVLSLFIISFIICTEMGDIFSVTAPQVVYC